MATALRYQGTAASRDGAAYKVRVRETGAVSPPALKTFDVQHIRVRKGERGANLFPGIEEASLVVDLLTDDADLLKDASAAEEGVYRCALEDDGGVARYRGYMPSDFYVRPILDEDDAVDGKVVKFPLSFEARVGFHRLEEMDFDVDPSQGRMTIAAGLCVILGKLSHGINLYCASDLFATTSEGGAMVDADPLGQTEFDPSVFFDRTDPPVDAPDDWQGHPSNCYDVLLALLGGDGEGSLRTLRMTEAPSGTIAYEVIERELLDAATYDRTGYVFDDATGAITSTFTETVDATVSEPVGGWVWESEPEEYYRHGYRQASVEYQHGKVPNLLTNGDFERWQSADPTTPAEWQTGGTLTGIGPVFGEDGKQALYLQRVDSGSTLDADTFDTLGYVELQDAHRVDVASGDILDLQADLFVEPLANSETVQEGRIAGQQVFVGFELFDGATTHHIQNGFRDTGGGRREILSDELTWENTPGYPAVLRATVGESASLRLVLPAAPADGDLRLVLYCPHDQRGETGSVIYRSLRLGFADAEGQTRTSLETTVADAGTGPKRDAVRTRLGDGPTKVFPSRLTVAGQQGYTTTWRKGFGAPGPGVPLAEYHAALLVRSQRTALRTWHGTILAAWGSRPPQHQQVLQDAQGRLIPTFTDWDVLRGRTEGEWVQSDLAAINQAATERPRGGSSVSFTGGVGRVLAGLSDRLLTRDEASELAIVRDDIAAGVQLTKIPVEALTEAVFRIGDKMILVDQETLTDQQATVSANQQANDDTITVQPVTFATPIRAGSPIITTAQVVQKALLLAEEQITLRVKKDDLLTEISLKLGEITFTAGIIKSNDWDGTTYDDGGKVGIDNPGTSGWAIAENGDAAFNNVFVRGVLTEAEGDARYYQKAEADSRFVNATGDAMTGPLTIQGGTAWHAGNDGAGSGLDADTVDGHQAAAFPRKAEQATITGAWAFDSVTSFDDSVYFNEEVEFVETALFQAIVSLAADLLPTTAYTSILGSADKKFLALHVAELIVSTLVASEERVTMAGRLLVGLGNELIQDVAAADAAIVVKANNLSEGDILHFEARGQVEFMAVQTDNGASGGGYSYGVTRNLDGTGANDWKAGDGVFNTGQAGTGFIDLHALNSLTNSGTVSGPTIAFYERTGAAYNAISLRAVVGNLRNKYGYGDAGIYGLAAGDPSADHVTIDATNGLRFRDGGATLAQLVGGTFTFGNNLSYDGTTLDAGGWEIAAAAIKKSASSGSLVLDSALKALRLFSDNEQTERTRISPAQVFLADPGNTVDILTDATERTFDNYTTESSPELVTVDLTDAYENVGDYDFVEIVFDAKCNSSNISTGTYDTLADAYVDLVLGWNRVGVGAESVAYRFPINGVGTWTNSLRLVVPRHTISGGLADQVEVLRWQGVDRSGAGGSFDDAYEVTVRNLEVTAFHAFTEVNAAGVRTRMTANSETTVDGEGIVTNDIQVFDQILIGGSGHFLRIDGDTLYFHHPDGGRKQIAGF